jgi:tRNA A-37 threonylcarbamoyl transferase component Bud32
MKCFFCGFENPEKVKFCGDCGNSLTGSNPKYDKKDSDLEMLNQHLSPKFVLEKKIGRGGMASVYLGDQTTLQRKIVVKILNEDISPDEEIRGRFLLEARVPAKLKHSNIVEIIDVGICNDRPYYIMEYASGGSLAEKIKKYKDKKVQFPFRESLEIIAKILDALNYCHTNDLFSHRDIKPANIMFRSNGEPIIVDFGIVKTSDASITRTRMTMGTANYMSPEQCQGLKDIDGRSDIYSVGIMLYELLAGELPFKGDTGLSIMIKQVKEKLPSLLETIKNKTDKPDPEFLKSVDKIEKIIQKACHKNRKKRFQSAGDFERDLLEVAGTKFNLIPVRESNFQLSWGLVFAFLFLGLGMGAFLVYKVVLETPKYGFQIDSVPPGATVIDQQTGKIDGNTPFRDSKPEKGIYTFKIILEGYEPESTILRLTNPGKTETTLLELRKSYGRGETASNFQTELIGKEGNPSIQTQTFGANGLNWQAGDIRRMNWYSAVSYCKNNGMRLPSKSELKHGFDSKTRALLASPCCEYWSSTTHEDDPSHAYNINVGNLESFFSSKTNLFYVRCVSK